MKLFIKSIVLHSAVKDIIYYSAVDAVSEFSQYNWKLEEYDITLHLNLDIKVVISPSELINLANHWED